MKFSLLLLSLFVFSSEIFAKSLTCGDARGEVKFKAEVKGDSLFDPILDGVMTAHLLGKVLGTKSKSGKWMRFGGLDDGRCWHAVILPSKVSQMENEVFRGVLDRVCDSSTGPISYRLNCKIK